MYILCCDFSARGVQFVRSHPLYDEVCSLNSVHHLIFILLLAILIFIFTSIPGTYPSLPV